MMKMTFLQHVLMETPCIIPMALRKSVSSIFSLSPDKIYFLKLYSK